MDVSPLFLANSQPPKLIEPSESPLHHPAKSAEPAAVFGIAHREPRRDAAGAQTLPDCRRIITTVTDHAIRTMSRTSMLSLQGWDGIDK